VIADHFIVGGCVCCCDEVTVGERRRRRRGEWKVKENKDDERNLSSYELIVRLMTPRSFKQADWRLGGTPLPLANRVFADWYQLEGGEREDRWIDNR